MACAHQAWLKIHDFQIQVRSITSSQFSRSSSPWRVARLSWSIEFQCHSIQRYSHFLFIKEWLILEPVAAVAVVVAEVEVEAGEVTEAEVWLFRYNQSSEVDLWPDILSQVLISHHKILIPNPIVNKVRSHHTVITTSYEQALVEKTTYSLPMWLSITHRSIFVTFYMSFTLV